jgi:hypothetical protein
MVIKMLKQSKIAILMIAIAIIAMAAPASAYFTSQNIETKAERIVGIADEARHTVMNLADRIESNATTMQLIIDAGLDGQFYGNLSICVEAGTTVGGETVTEDGEGWTYLNAANQSLLAGEYEDAIANARDALAIFRDVLKSIHVILLEAGVETGQVLDSQVIQEAIDRSLDRIAELRALLSDEAEITSKLDEAENLLNEATSLLELNETTDAAANLREANALISQVCLYLKNVAERLNPDRIRGFLDEAYQYRERFRERFGRAWNEEIDVDKFLQALGYQNEEEFMAHFQEMIQNAQGAENIEDAIQSLKEIGQMIRTMDANLTQEMSHHGGNFGQAMPSSGFGQDGSSSFGQGIGSGFGNMGGGNSP